MGTDHNRSGPPGQKKTLRKSHIGTVKMVRSIKILIFSGGLHLCEWMEDRLSRNQNLNENDQKGWIPARFPVKSSGHGLARSGRALDLLPATAKGFRPNDRKRICSAGGHPLESGRPKAAPLARPRGGCLSGAPRCIPVPNAHMGALYPLRS